MGTLSDLPPVNSAPKLFSQGRFWLVHDEKGIFALHSSCTHLECRFSWDTERNNFVCPCHGSEFTREGMVLNGPARRDLDRFPVQLFSEKGVRLISETEDEQTYTPVSDYLEQILEKRVGENMADVIHVKVDTGTRIMGKEHDSQS